MPQEQSDDLGGAIITTVAVDNLTDAGASVLDAVLSVVEETGTAVADAGTQVLQHVPVVGVLFKLYKAGVAINQQVFARKLSNFLNALTKVPLKERIAFVEDLSRDPAFRQKVGDNLVLLLDKADDVDKADLFGKLFAFYINGSINYNTYMRFASIINRAHYPDLMALKKSTYKEGVSEPVFTQLEIEGLSSVGITGEVSVANGDPFNYNGPTIPPSPDRMFAHFTLLGSQLSNLIKA